MTQRSGGRPDRFVVSVTVNLHGTSVELREVGREALYGRYSHGRYTTNVGARRLLELFDRHGIPATFFVPAQEAEEHPSVVRAITAAGHEVAAHGYAMEDHATLDAADELDLLARAHRTLSAIAGSPPVGWRAPGGQLSGQTLRHLSSLGYRYDSSFQDDDRPYRLDADGGLGMIELPQNEMLIDATLYGLRQTHDRVLNTWIEEFDALRDERGYVCLTLHPRADYGSGRASRIETVDAFLHHVRREKAVEFTTCADAVDAAVGETG